MAKKIKKSDIDKLIKTLSYKAETLKINIGEGEVSVKVDINSDVGTKMTVFRNVCSMIFGNDGTYNPGMYSFAYKCALIYCFTDLKIEDADQMFLLAEKTNFIENVEKLIPAKVLDDFKCDFEKSVNFYGQYVLKSKAFAMYDKLTKIMSSIDQLTERFDNIDDQTIINSLAGIANDNNIES